MQATRAAPVLRVGGARTGSGRFTNLVPSTSAEGKKKKTQGKEKESMQVIAHPWPGYAASLTLAPRENIKRDSL